MESLSARARVTGLLYLFVCLVGPVRLIYIPSVLLGSGDSATIAGNIASHQGLMWAGIFCDLLTATVELFVVLRLYMLFRSLQRDGALAMLVLGLMDVPIYFMNTLNDVGAVLFARNSSFLAAFDQAQRQAMTMFFVTLHHYGVVVNEVFWGLWLLPLGVLVYRSGFLPRLIGGWLVLNGFAYLAENAAGILAPQYSDVVATIAFPVQFGEIAFVLWLIIMGARSGFARPSASSA